MAKPLPPSVGERLARCGTHVDVWGIVPGADVTLEFNGGQQTLTVNATATTFTVAGLTAGAKVRAQQKSGPDLSDWGNRVIVEEVQLPPAPPLTESTIARCAQCIAAWGVAPGSHVQINRGNLVTAEGDAGRDGLVCMTMTQPPGLSYDSVTITCGAPSPGKGHIGTYQATEPLPPPVIVQPVFECQSKISFEGLVPGATVEIFVTDSGGITSSLGTFCACTSRVNANVPRIMKSGDRLKAIQFMINDRWECHLRGKESAEIPVEPPDQRIKPVLGAPLYEGDPVLHVTNQIEGGTITLLSRDNAAAPENELGSRPSSEYPEVPVPAPGLHKDQVVRISQELCGVKEFSDPVTVLGLPATIDPPTVRKEVFACAEIVIVDAVIPGATVFVQQTPPNPPSTPPPPQFPMGNAWTAGTTAIVGVAPTPVTDSLVSAFQVVGGKPSGPSDPVKVKMVELPPPPTVVPPVKVGDLSVWCEGLLPGAHVRVFDRGVPIGAGTAIDVAGPIPLYSAVPQGGEITAAQALCREGRPSDPPVRARSAAECPGPPTYDPGKWNDGGEHQGCNNCYNYACDKLLDNFAQPGGGLSKSQINCNDVTDGALDDGLRRCVTSHCHPCHHRVALCIRPPSDPKGPDYHWYRQDVDGTWSHKPGCDTARNWDNSHNPITDPSTANRGGYTDFCGYFCVYKPEVSIGGGFCKCWP